MKRGMKLFITAALFGATIILTACGGGGSGSSGSDPKGSTFAEQLVGTWGTACNAPGTDSPLGEIPYYWSASESYFENLVLEIEFALFSRAGCSNKVDSLIVEGMYSVGAAVTDASGVTAYKVDAVIDNIYSESGRSIDLASIGVVLPLKFYDLEYINGKLLYSGDYSTGDGTSAANRPTQIDYDMYLTRR